MPRADELEPGDRTRVTGLIVEVEHVEVFTNRARIHYRWRGVHGTFVCPPHVEMEDCS